MSASRKVAKVAGGAITVLNVIVLVGLAYLGASGNADLLAKMVNPAYLSPVALLTYILVGLTLLKYGTAEPDVAALHESNTKLQLKVEQLEEAQRGRHLTEAQRSEIIRAAASWLATLDPPGPTDGPPEVVLVAVGSAQETIDYRRDFERAFDASGFDVLVTEWKAGNPEAEQFRGLVTVLREQSDERNTLIPALLDALRRAGIPAKTAPHPRLLESNKSRPGSLLRFRFQVGRPPVAYVVVGQRS
jgi:hypothetical protein